MRADSIQCLLANMRVTRPGHLPIVAAFCRKIDLIGTVNRSVPSNMGVDIGTIVQGVVLDTLSGRSPLYRLADFFQHQDSELLLGRQVSPSAFSDTNVGRAMEDIYEAGAGKVFSDVAFQAALNFPLDMRHVHFDTTSVSVWGAYDICCADSEPVNVTHGKSKDLRPDLKQFLIAMLCVGRNIPIVGRCEDGNASDKSLNNELLTRISKHMARHGLAEGDFVYTSDCALVTPDNLGS